ncbi:MAG: 2-amino-4-hydroxy-6-hydroxymethyldihydropteridine diphosphokinase [Candidatus Zixiibacteriota bacterium]|nr:MAG: 2-amino-4-hydroxy-6-hydroxymethyldihydropteridine diphosphokinase [candidate division Zixibacteria bacterium]
MNTVCYLLLGSNLGDRETNLRAAVESLDAIPGIMISALSSVYETTPQEMSGEPPLFLNQAVAIETTLAPADLLIQTESVERRLGRTDKGNYRSRLIDIDILYFGDRIVTTKTLTIPHPRVLQRGFALVPLVELAPELIDPVAKRPVIEYLAAVDTADIHLYQSRVAHAG